MVLQCPELHGTLGYFGCEPLHVQVCMAHTIALKAAYLAGLCYRYCTTAGPVRRPSTVSASSCACSRRKVFKLPQYPIIPPHPVRLCPPCPNSPRPCPAPPPPRTLYVSPSREWHRSVGMAAMAIVAVAATSEAKPALAAEKGAKEDPATVPKEVDVVWLTERRQDC